MNEKEERQRKIERDRRQTQDYIASRIAAARPQRQGQERQQQREQVERDR